MVSGSDGEILMSESLRMGPSSLRNCMAQQDLPRLEDLADHAGSCRLCQIWLQVSKPCVRRICISPLCAPFSTTSWTKDIPGALGNLETCNWSWSFQTSCNQERESSEKHSEKRHTPVCILQIPCKETHCCMYTPNPRVTHVDHTVIGHFLELYSHQQNKVTPYRLVWISKGHHSALEAYVCVCVCASYSVMSDSFRLRGPQPTGSSVHGILQARILEWVVISFSVES